MGNTFELCMMERTIAHEDRPVAASTARAHWGLRGERLSSDGAAQAWHGLAHDIWNVMLSNNDFHGSSPHNP